MHEHLHFSWFKGFAEGFQADGLAAMGAVAGEVGSVRSGTIKGLSGERRRLRCRGVPEIPVGDRSPLAQVLRSRMRPEIAYGTDQLLPSIL
jgi:hypothetical protein